MKGVDLFSGVGGMSAGLGEAGLEIVAAYDHWPAATATYRANLGDHAQELDLSDVDVAAERIAAHDPDLIAGGPPCQDFSTAGKRKEGARANLTIAFAQIVEACRPSIVLMENVPQVRRSASYAEAKGILEGAGYSITESIIDSSFFGVPQIRKRFFMSAWLDNADAPSRFLEWLDDNKAAERLTVKKYLSNEIDIDFYYRHARNYSRRAIFTVHEPSPTIRGVNRPIPPNYRRNHLDSAPPESARPLTSVERSRIQTFPPDWNWGEGVRDRNATVELLIGNAVPVKLAEAVGGGLVHAAG